MRRTAIDTDHPLLASVLLGCPPGETPLRHVERVPPQPPVTADWPDWAAPELTAALAAVGISAPWPHQVQAAEHAWAGESVVIATGTASGKSLAYQLPMLSAVLADRSRVLYLSPTKALAADQLRALSALGLAGVRAATLDGDTPFEERDWIRQHANVVLSNPDLLHRTLLPQHQRWSSLLRRLRFVVVDECHHYRGVFGSNVSLVLRRLRRLCAFYGAAPVFVLASATSATPGESAARLVGLPMRTVEQDRSPRGSRTFALWEPPLALAAALPGDPAENPAGPGTPAVPVRRAAGAEAARLLADLVIAGARTLVFVRSRRGAELTALAAKRHLAEAGAGELADRVAAYRGGYLPAERRALERSLTEGELLGVATTNALELGVDITGLDAVVLAGYPGTLASLWQQAGRAGRRGQDALVVFIARDDPLDTYLVNNPAAIFARPVEASVTDPANPHVLGPQLCCAAAELALTGPDVELFGGRAAEPVLAALVEQGLLRRRPTGWFWTDRSRPAANLRGAGQPVAVVEAASGSLLGTVDAGTAPATVHPQAVYLHQGSSFVVEDLDLEAGAALVRAEEPPWTTCAQEVTDIAIRAVERSAQLDGVSVGFGTVEVSHQVVSYQRRRFNGELLDQTPLEMPLQRLVTRAVWYTLDEATVADTGLDQRELPGALHAAEHAAIGLLPLFATCDRWDIGGVSTALHPDTGRATVFVYDGHPGGAGFAARGHAVLAGWLDATRGAIAGCECPTGCPSCIQSPKCGN
ncbi:MAG: box helicase protein, partial [Pseudonocardiales bacterium]|nr:box helicase protein [Pseudonocardiales bacterium]